MNTFALATLTLSTLCLGGAFAAIVTARHVRLRRDAEDRRALGRVLEDVDHRLARLAAAEESSATAQIVGRLAQLDERLAALVAESAARTRRVEEAQQREHGAWAAARLATGALAGHEQALAEPLREAAAESDAFGAEEPSAATPDAQDDDPELAALLAKFDDDAFSFRGKARSGAKGSGTETLSTARASAAATLERPLAPLQAVAPVDENEDESEIAVSEAAASDAATSPDGDLDAELRLALPDDDDVVLDEVAESEPEVAEPEVAVAESEVAELAVEPPIAEAVEALEPDLATDELGEELTEELAGELAETVAEEVADGADAEFDTEFDDELELDDLVLFFHEDDQGEPSDANQGDLALFDEEPQQAAAAEDASAGVLASAASAPRVVHDDVAPAPIDAAIVAADPAPASEAEPTYESTAPAPTPKNTRPAPAVPGERRRSIDELRSLTELLSAPQRDRSERLRLVNELRDALTRVRR